MRRRHRGAGVRTSSDTKTRSQYTRLAGEVHVEGEGACRRLARVITFRMRKREVKYPIGCFRTSRKCGLCAAVSDR